MKVGYRCVHAMCAELAAFMDRHKFSTLAEFKGRSLSYFTTHYDLVRRQSEARQLAKTAGQAGIKADHEWSGDEFVKQSDALARG
jgi:hypothetical protein